MRPTPGQHGTFKDCEARLPYVAAMGFDVLYLTPHPSHRRLPIAKVETTPPMPAPMIRGARGRLARAREDTRRFIPNSARWRTFGASSPRRESMTSKSLWISPSNAPPTIRMCSNIPNGFGSVLMAPCNTPRIRPRNIEDIYPLDFETEHWQALWDELKSVVLFWVEQGVRIFRVDNPHTKSFRFWEWLIREVKQAYPDVIFLAEAFTRPKVMYNLAKRGFTQSYTYFAWRNSKRRNHRVLHHPHPDRGARIFSP